MSGEITLGVKVFNRTEKLTQLLNSASTSDIDQVLIIDDGGEQAGWTALRESDWMKTGRAFELPTDRGVGAGRRTIARELETEFLLVVDPDHQLPPNVSDLEAQLRADPDLGGVAGVLLEDGQLYATAHDLHDDGDVLSRDVREEKPAEIVAGRPLVRFDFLPNACLFRRECVRDYSWDSEYTIEKAHLDFYVGHTETEWEFGLSPTVVFGHDPGGDESYESERFDEDKHQESRSYFLDKWDFESIALGTVEWHARPIDPDPTNALLKRAVMSSPQSLKRPVSALRDAARSARGDQPL